MLFRSDLIGASGWSVPAEMPLVNGMILECERPGNRWRSVVVLEPAMNGKVKIRYLGWGADNIPRSSIRFPTGVTVD